VDTFQEQNIEQKLAKILPDSWTGSPLSTQFDIFVETYVLEFINYFFFIAVLVFLGVTRKYYKKFSLLFYLLVFAGLSSVIYALSPERFGVISLIDSRNLYFVSIGMSIFISTITRKLARKFNVIFLFPLLLLACLHIWCLEKQLSLLGQEGVLRKSILTTIYKQYPTLSPTTVFFIESDASYYGLDSETKTVPFQSGFGQTLLVWYYPTARFPDQLMNQDFLWNIKSEDYRFIEGRGFGYFRTYQKLQQSYRENHLSPNQIIAFSWKSATKELLDITPMIRMKLRRL